MWTEVENRSDGQQLGKLCFVSHKSALKPSSSQKKVSPPIVEDIRGKFYEHYHKEAGDYDNEFIKKHDDDLGNTLIFVCCEYC